MEVNGDTQTLTQLLLKNLEKLKPRGRLIKAADKKRKSEKAPETIKVEDEETRDEASIPRKQFTRMGCTFYEAKKVEKA